MSTEAYEIKFIKIREIQTRTQLARSTIYYHIKLGVLPNPIKLGGRASAWLEHEINQILAARIAGYSDEAIISLVQQLENDRPSILPKFFH